MLPGEKLSSVNRTLEKTISADTNAQTRRSYKSEAGRMSDQSFKTVSSRPSQRATTRKSAQYCSNKFYVVGGLDSIDVSFTIDKRNKRVIQRTLGSGRAV